MSNQGDTNGASAAGEEGAAASAEPAVVGEAASAWKFQAAPVAVQMDPRLQRVCLRRLAGLSEAATVSSAENEVNVVAKVTEVGAWSERTDVRLSQMIGDYDGETAIVTGRVPVQRLENLRAQPFVVSLKAAQTIRPALEASVRETRARSEDLPEGSLAQGGAGVVVGVVDYGCDFAHQNFRDGSGNTRLDFIWHQGGTPKAGTATPSYGREYSQTEIDAALNQSAPYDALGYGPAPDSPAQTGTHGTHVMDIAAGNGRGTGRPGLAPEADLIFVHVAHGDIPFTGSDVVLSSFGDSVMLLEAIQYIFDKAGTRPCVINISLGTNGGPKDGSTLVEEGMDRLLRDRPDRAIVISASNSFDDGIHAQGTVADGGTTDLIWEVPLISNSHDEFELWYDGASRFAVELILPNGNSLGIVEPGEQARASNDTDQALLLIVNRVGDPNNGDNQIGIFLEQGVPSGQWTVRLHGRRVDGGGAFHAWIERDNVSPSRFAPPHDNTHTIGSISCGHEIIVVGSYNAHHAKTPLSWFSSAGPTRDGREKPEISAPGHGVVAAHSRTGSGAISKSGTSMAAPAVSGIVALMLAEARGSGLTLSINDIRTILVTTARREPPAGAGWHDRYGHGRIDAAAVLDEVRRRAAEYRKVS